MDRRRFLQVAGLAALGTAVASPGAGAAVKQRGWQHCKKCQGLIWDLGSCPAGEKHSLDDPTVYILTANDPNAPGQQKWRSCPRCQALWYGGGDAKGKCPEGGAHSEAGSWDYVLASDGNGQKDWHQCSKCHGLFFAGAVGTGVCPAGEGHAKAEGSAFTLEYVPYKRSVTGEEAPGFDVLDAIMEKYLTKIGCTAASLTVTRSHHGTPNGMQPTADVAPLFSRGYGWCDLEQEVPTQPDTPMAIGSCEKPFVAASIRQLALDGKLDLNASVFKLLKIEPKGKVIDNRVWDITVNHLLDHKAGWQGEPLAKAHAAAGERDPAKYPSTYEWIPHVLEYVMIQNLRDKPGEKYDYDNFGYGVLTAIVARVSGQGWPDYIRSQLCRPFGKEELLWIRQNGPPRKGEPPGLWNGIDVNGIGKGDLAAVNFSTPAMCTFMRHFWVGGQPRDNGNPTWFWFGSWVNSSAMMCWRSEGLNVAVAFNGRRAIDGDWAKELNEAIDQLVRKNRLPPPPRPPANLLVNGSFEQGPPVGDVLSLDPGSTVIKGWKVTRGQIDVHGTHSKAQDGARCLDLHGSPGYGGIEQPFKTTIGQRYRVTFAMAGNPDGTVPLKRLAVRAAGKKQEFAFDTTGRKHDNLGWVEYAWEFEAVTENTTVEFHTAMNSDPACGPMLDNVRVWAVPAQK